VDDDTYVRVGLLMGALRRMPRAYAFMGHIEQPGGHPHRDPKSKWHVSPEEWGSKKYPSWAHGAGAPRTTNTAS
jgi:Galactosyltransferase